MFRPSTVCYSILNAMKFENIHRDLLHEQSFWWKQNLKAIIYLLFCRVSRSALHGNGKFNILSCLENNSKVSNSLISETKLTSWKLFSTQWLSKFSRFTQVSSIFRVSRSKSVTMSPPLSSQLSEVNFFVLDTKDWKQVLHDYEFIQKLPVERQISALRCPLELTAR